MRAIDLPTRTALSVGVLFEDGMGRDRVVVAALFGVGVAGFLAAYLIHTERAKHFTDRPEANGDVGSILVYAQRPEGPFHLQPGRKRTLSRPQDLSFQWNVNGAGPRELRIEMTSEGKTTVLHEEKLSAPADHFPLEYVFHIDDRMPDELELAVILEAPHSTGYESRYPLTIVGSDKHPLEVDETSTPAR